MALDHTATSGERSFSDSLQRVRRHGSAILIIALACGAASYGFSTTRPSVYRAQAFLAFVDQSQDLSILGSVAVRGTEPDQLASAKADEVTRPEALTAVRDQLNLSLSVADLARRYSATVDPTSNLVVVTASAPRPDEAARLANGLANVAVTEAVRQARNRYVTAAKGIAARLAKLRPGRSNDATRRGLEDTQLRLESLGALASPANLARTAPPPSSPSSPKPLRNGFIGALFGLLLAPILVLMRVSLDRRVHDPAEIAHELSLPVLGKVGEDTLGRVVFATTSADDTQRRALEAFRMLRSNLSALATEPGFIAVAVTSALPEAVSYTHLTLPTICSV